MQLSIVTTLYGSAPYLAAFHQRITAQAEALGGSYEIVLVNDGSPDSSLAMALQLQTADPHVLVVDLARNFGHHKAIMTGLAHASGDRIYLTDVDLEEAPEWLGDFAAAWQRHAEVDVVFGVQERRKGGAFERASGAIFYAAFNALSEQKVPRDLVTSRLMSRRYVEALIAHRERELYLAGLWTITGFAQVPISVRKLSKGETTWTLRRKVTAAVNAITAFSAVPLVLIFWSGIAVCGVAVLMAAKVASNWIRWGQSVPGWTSIVLSVWFLGGLILFSLGVVGIYLAKVFAEVKQRPYTIVRAVHRPPVLPAPPQHSTPPPTA